MIKAIIFDCFGVLTADAWKEFVATLPETKRHQASELNRAYGAANLSKDEFLRAIQKLTGRLPPDIDTVFDNDLGTTKNTQLLNYISTLKTNYKIGLLSNVGSDWIKQRFLNPEEQVLFDNFVFSFEARMTKPNPGMFHLMAKRLNVPLETCVLIDDVEYNCTIAVGQGMRAIHYRNFEQTKTELEKLLKN